MRICMSKPMPKFIDNYESPTAVTGPVHEQFYLKHSVSEFYCRWPGGQGFPVLKC